MGEWGLPLSNDLFLIIETSTLVTSAKNGTQPLSKMLKKAGQVNLEVKG